MTVPDPKPYRSPSPDRTVWTVADLEAIPDDGNRYEILHGELLVTPPPLLVVEILSPSTRRRDRHRKRPTYLSHGVGDV